MPNWQCTTIVWFIMRTSPPSIEWIEDRGYWLWGFPPSLIRHSRLVFSFTVNPSVFSSWQKLRHSETQSDRFARNVRVNYSYLLIDPKNHHVAFTFTSLVCIKQWIPISVERIAQNTFIEKNEGDVVDSSTRFALTEIPKKLRHETAWELILRFLKSGFSRRG